MRVRIYIEGGGDQERTLRVFRSGFTEFFKKVVQEGRQPRVIAGGSRNQTFDRFQHALAAYPDEWVLLLVDSEGPVPGAAEPRGRTARRPAGGAVAALSASGQISPWNYLEERDQWKQPAGTTDEQAHLMVQCMEAWFLADKEALVKYYGQGFRPNALPVRSDVEAVPKDEVFQALQAASRDTKTKGTYDKLRHGSEILARIDPAKVRGASRHAATLFDLLLRVSSP